MSLKPISSSVCGEVSHQESTTRQACLEHYLIDRYWIERLQSVPLFRKELDFMQFVFKQQKFSSILQVICNPRSLKTLPLW